MSVSYKVARLIAQHLQGAVGQGLAAATLVDFSDGSTIAVATAGITDEELRPLVVSAIRRCKRHYPTTRNGGRGMFSFTLDDREVAFGQLHHTADRPLLVAVLSATSCADLNLACAQHDRASELLDQIERVIPRRGHSVAPPLPTQRDGSGGTGSEPADLQLIEYGITVRRDRGKS